MGKDYAVQATQTSFRILELLAELDGAGVTKIANQLEISKSAIHNHLQTLQQMGYVTRTGQTYTLGYRFLYLAVSARARIPLVGIAKSKLDNLAVVTGEVASLMIEDAGVGIYLYRSVGHDRDAPLYTEGEPVPLYRVAIGRAILAFLPDDRIESIMHATTTEADEHERLADPGELRAELQMIRERGLSFSRGEQSEDVSSVAAPIRDTDGEILGAISVSGSTTDLSGKRLEEDVTGLVLSTAREIEVDLQ